MEFTTGQPAVCDGGEHYTLPITIQGQQRIIHFTKDQLAELQDEVDLPQRILCRLVAAVKESGATTLQQIANAIKNKTFNV